MKYHFSKYKLQKNLAIARFVNIIMFAINLI